MSENARTVFSKRYLVKDEKGLPTETVEDAFFRVALNVARRGLSDPPVAKELRNCIDYYDMLTEWRFLPNSPTFTGAGTPLGQLAACFVLPVDDEMGQTSDGIMSTLRNAALIQQTGGGNGFSFSRLREKGARVSSSGGTSSGPVAFMRAYDSVFGTVAQGGTRRGANMAVLRVDHPDIEEFIKCKSSENSITNFNISVGITDKFMEAFLNDDDFELLSPHTKKVTKTMKARELMALITTYAHRNGEPGVLFLDTANRYNPVPKLYELESTNPCGEQWLGPYENCCLGSINLANHTTTTESGEVVMDWDQLKKTVEIATRFLDDVVDANEYVPAVPQLKEAALRCRRIGLGIMGLADYFYKTGVRYGSEDSQTEASNIMQFVRYHTMLTSIELASERGAFPAIEDSIYNPREMMWLPPTGFATEHVDWCKVVEGIRTHGIRNACTTTIAPTGTLATVSSCEGYGCEPVFALAYFRNVVDGDNMLKLRYVSPLFEEALMKLTKLPANHKWNVAIDGGEPLNTEEVEIILDAVAATGSCGVIKDLDFSYKIPDSIYDTFVVSSDITADEHVGMQASLQDYVDNSISKTCNFPSTATREDVEQCYVKAWKKGCKGLTVYVTGSRDKVVLETKETMEKRQRDTQPKSETPDVTPLEGDFAHNWRETSSEVSGLTYTCNTPLGKVRVTINEDLDGPIETFINVSKAGSETSAVGEALGRLMSLMLRMPSQLTPDQRLKEVCGQLDGIGGRRSTGFGKNRIRSLPDGIANCAKKYLTATRSVTLSASMDGLTPVPEDSLEVQTTEADEANGFADLCPDCGEHSFVNEEGCRKCYSCGHSEC